MGLWGKVKGVFGRIGGGIKKGYNWIKDHFGQIKDVTDKAMEFVPGQYKPAAMDAYNKGIDVAGRLGLS